MSVIPSPEPTLDPTVEDELKERVAKLEQQCKAAADPNALCMCVFSGELDKLLAAFMIATSAAASGMKVSTFFTFWGTAALKKAGPQSPGKRFMEKVFGWMPPGGLHKRRLSKMDMGGLGRQMITHVMKQQQAADLPTFIAMARETDVQICLCSMSMSLMGIRQEELIDCPYAGICGATHFVGLATVDDPAFPLDVQAWCKKTGHDLLQLDSTNGRWTATIRKSA